MEIIDSHIHPPLNDGRNYHWFPETEPVESPDAFVAQLKLAGITSCCGAVIFRPQTEGDNKFARTSRMNQSALEFRHKVGEFYLPGLQLDLNEPEKSCTELEYYYHTEGFRWIGEMYSRASGGELFISGGAFQVYDLVQKLGLPVSISCTRIEILRSICQEFPKLNVVLSQVEMILKDTDPWLKLTRNTDNLYLDLAASITSRFGLIKKVVEEVGSHKVIFGSGFPVRCPQSVIASYLAAGLNDSQLEAIFSLNFKRLTGMM